MKTALAVAINILFVSNYFVCEYLYPGSNKSWDIFIPMDKLSHNIWAIIIMLSIATTLIKEPANRLSDFFLTTAIGLSSSDVIDRIVFHITNFTGADRIVVPATIVLAIYNYRSDTTTRTKIK